jgi:eukaryotic-like serine/threonine-protein kinase
MIAPRPRERGPSAVLEEEEYEEPPPQRPLWPWIVAAAFVIAALVAGFFVWQELAGGGGKVPVGRYVGERATQAELQIKHLHLRPVIKRGPNNKYGPGFVYDQNPSAGSKVAKDGPVTIFVSTGKPKVAIPNVVGQQWTQVKQQLVQLGLVPVEHIVGGGKKGVVSATVPKVGTKVRVGSKVDVNVESGPAPVAVPDVRGETVPQATAALHDAGFNYVLTYVQSNATANTVISESPAPGTNAPQGSKVSLTVSNGPPQKTVPSVVNETAQQATHDLEAAGFHVTEVQESTSDPNQNNIVLSQNPSGGSSATEGTTVTIYVGQFSGGGGTTTTTP